MAHPMKKLGKQAARHDPKTVKLGPILAKHLPAVPKSADYGSKITFPMWLNNFLGCCTQVAVSSAILVFTMASQGPVTLADTNVETNYETSGYDPSKVLPDKSNPTDNGDTEVDVLNRWCSVGFERPGQTRDYLSGYGYVDPKNFDNVKRAIAMLGGLYIGLALPGTAMEGTDWVVVPNAKIAGGHAVFVHGYDADWLYLNSWGEKIRMSWEFLSTYCDEAYGLLSRQNWFNIHGMTPLGEAYQQVAEELEAAMAA